MTTGKVLVRLALLVVLTVGGLYYIVFDALQLHLGTSGYDVSLNLPRAGGLYQGAYVSLRGVEVGRVTSLQVEPTQVVAHLHLAQGTKISDDTDVRVRDLSAVGEQYVDFVPQSDAGPYLASGSVVTVPGGNLPITVGTILHDGSAFARSINTPDVQTLLQTLTAALGGTGPSLRSLLASGQTVAANLEAVQPSTVDVLNSGHTLLQTGIATNGDVNGFSTNLAQLSAQLKASDNDIRLLISNGTPAATTLGQTLSMDTASLQSVLSNTAVLTGTAAANTPAVQAFLQTLPIALNGLASVAKGNYVNGKIFFNAVNDVCSYGTEPGQPNGQAPVALDLTRTCNRTAPDLQQRGSQYAPEP